MEKTLAYLGPEWTYSHVAALRCQQEPSVSPCTVKPYPSIPHVLYGVDNGSADLAIVPAENSIEGSINVTLDMLARELNLYIRAEMVQTITHHLLSFAKGLDKIRTVISHPQPLAQCRRFLTQKLNHAQIREMPSTAEAVKALSRQEPEIAAIGSWDSHINYKVPILIPDVGDYPHNQTRFILVSKERGPEAHTSKTSLVLALEKDRPGGLYDVLGEFARHGINLTRIESRPAKGELGSYLFFIDCEAGGDHPGLLEALSSLEKKTVMLKNLGSYSTL